LLQDSQKRRDQKNRSQQRRYYSEDGRPKQIFQTAKRRAKLKGLEFTITLDWIVGEIAKQDGRCAMTGIPFDYTKDERYTKHPYSLSLDRIDNAQGYTPNNTRVVCAMYNYCKNVARDEDVEFFAWQLFQHKFGVRPK